MTEQSNTQILSAEERKPITRRLWLNDWAGELNRCIDSDPCGARDQIVTAADEYQSAADALYMLARIMDQWEEAGRLDEVTFVEARDGNPMLTAPVELIDQLAADGLLEIEREQSAADELVERTGADD